MSTAITTTGNYTLNATAMRHRHLQDLYQLKFTTLYSDAKNPLEERVAYITNVDRAGIEALISELQQALR